ncbi:MAG: hypothetical protein KAJ49_01945, partial [Arcobacteraceae bacterium]|nr:hypothetical protein [Arcobacteraceae bacterium]
MKFNLKIDILLITKTKKVLKLSQINKYEISINSNTFHNFLDDLLINIKQDYKKYNLKNGFISFLDETKISEKFVLISAVGRFLNNDNLNIISAKEVDILSIVHMSKKSLFKNNIYVDNIQKNEQEYFAE